METKTIAYKVVRNVNGKLFSAIIKGGHLMTRYEIGKWTVKRKYGPLVFKTYYSAVAWANEYAHTGRFQIYECETEYARPVGYLVGAWEVVKFNHETIRRRMDRATRLHWGKNAPEGSLITSRIKLIRLVSTLY